MNTNLVKINATQLISPDVLLVETPDTDTFSNFEITSENGDNTLQIKLDDTDDEISLKKNGIVSFLNDRFNFKINEDGDVGGVLKIVEVGGPGATETATVEPIGTGIGNETKTVPGEVATGKPTAAATTVVEETVKETETEKQPGFEAVFAIAGLLAVAYLVLRKRD
jgi:PGF-CTERM protein